MSMAIGRARAGPAGLVQLRTQGCHSYFVATSSLLHRYFIATSSLLSTLLLLCMLLCCYYVATQSLSLRQAQPFVLAPQAGLDAVSPVQAQLLVEVVALGRFPINEARSGVPSDGGSLAALT